MMAHWPSLFLPRGAKMSLRYLASFVPPGWRTSRGYQVWRRRLEAARDWPSERVRSWQWDMIHAMVVHAYRHTGGYRRLFDEAGVDVRELRRQEDLRRLPFTTKSMLQERLPEFSDPGNRGRYVTTGGSTGIPLGFFAPHTECGRELAFGHAAWAKLGWAAGSRCAVLRGAYIGSEEQPWIYDRYHRALLLSSYYLTERSLGSYVDALRRFEPQSLQAYPSAFDLLCRLLESEGRWSPPALPLVLLGSENVYDWQLSRFQRLFPRTTFFAWYGHAEKAAYAPWCAGSRLYHVDPLYGYVELLRDDGAEAAEGEEGEIVATSLYNHCTPLIRYRTMDRAVRGPARCPSCGSSALLLSRISGRSHELILTATGRLISMTAINMHDDTFDALRQFQFLQQERGKVVFRYVPKAPLTESQSQEIRLRLQAKLGDDVHLSLRAVPEIPRSRSGKLGFLDQRLAVQAGALRVDRSCA